MSDYRPVTRLFDKIDEPARSACFRLLGDNITRFCLARGSSHNHQAWPGGYLDHVRETMNLATLLYEALAGSGRELPFRLSDALLVMFLHDVEKPWKYEFAEDGTATPVPEMKSKAAQREFREHLLESYLIELTPDQRNAMRYVEGEGDDYSRTARVAGPLAAFCHMCDMASARLWFDYPLAGRDPWAGDSRRAR